MAAPGSARYVALAGAVAMLAAIFLLAARLLKLGFLSDFLSQTVLVGFLTGVGIQVAIAMLGDMLGIEMKSHRTLAQLVRAVQNSRAPIRRRSGFRPASLPEFWSSGAWRRGFPGRCWRSSARSARARCGISRTTGSPSSGRSRGPPRNRAARRLVAGRPDASADGRIVLSDDRRPERGDRAGVRGQAAPRTVSRPPTTMDMHSALSLANLAAACTGAFVVNGSPTKAQIVDKRRRPHPAGAVARRRGHRCSASGAAAPDRAAGLPAPTAALAAVVFLIGVPTWSTLPGHARASWRSARRGEFCGRARSPPRHGRGTSASRTASPSPSSHRSWITCGTATTRSTASW